MIGSGRTSGLAAALFVTITVTGCPPNRDAGGGSPGGPSATTAGASTSALTTASGGDVLMPGNNEPSSGQGALDDAAVLGVARVLNRGEVDQAQAVQGRLTEAAAKDFAAMMIKDHGAALEKVAALEKELGVTATESPTKEKVEREGNAVLERLKAVNADLDRTYLVSQVTMHRSALKVLDEELIPSAKADKLRTALTEMRGHVARHLEVAEEATQGGGPGPADHKGH